MYFNTVVTISLRQETINSFKQKLHNSSSNITNSIFNTLSKQVKEKWKMITVVCHLQWRAGRSTTVYIVNKQIRIIMLTIDQVETLKSPNTPKRHFVVQMDRGIIIRNNMQVNSSASRNT